MKFTREELIDYLQESIDVGEDEAYYDGYEADFQEMLESLRGGDEKLETVKELLSKYEYDIELYLKHRG